MKMADKIYYYTVSQFGRGIRTIATSFGGYLNIDVDLVEGFLNGTIKELPHPYCCVEETLSKILPNLQIIFNNLITTMKLIC